VTRKVLHSAEELDEIISSSLTEKLNHQEKWALRKRLAESLYQTYITTIDKCIAIVQDVRNNKTTDPDAGFALSQATSDLQDLKDSVKKLN